MGKINSVEDFNKFMEDIREKIQASDITIDDEWMQDDVLDEIYHGGTYILV